jgi:hypothetical protein
VPDFSQASAFLIGVCRIPLEERAFHAHVSGIEKAELPALVQPGIMPMVKCFLEVKGV